jgi:hypothetical protein
MNRWLIAGIIGFCACFIGIVATNRAIACPDCDDCGGVDLSLLDGVVRYLSPGQRTILRVYAEDFDTVECMELCGETQEITGFDWSFPSGIQHGPVYDPSPCNCCISTVEVWSDTPGRYCVNVGATDNDGNYTGSSFTVWVVSLDLDIASDYVTAGYWVSVSLSWAPDTPPGCFALYTSSQAGAEGIRVWDQTKTTVLIPAGGGLYRNMTSRFPHTVWIEGIECCHSYLYFDYCPGCNTVYPLDDWAQDDVRVVDVKIYSPFDADLDGKIDDYSNEFSFDAADPAVLSIGCQAVECIYLDSQYVFWTIEDIGNIRGVWSPHVPGNIYMGQGYYPTVTFTGMPANNSDFGPKVITLSTSVVAETDQETIEVFFEPLAKNNPGPAAETPPGDIAEEDLVE